MSRSARKCKIPGPNSETLFYFLLVPLLISAYPMLNPERGFFHKNGHEIRNHKPGIGVGESPLRAPCQNGFRLIFPLGSNNKSRESLARSLARPTTGEGARAVRASSRVWSGWWTAGLACLPSFRPSVRSRFPEFFTWEAPITVRLKADRPRPPAPARWRWRSSECVSAGRVISSCLAA